MEASCAKAGGVFVILDAEDRGRFRIGEAFDITQEESACQSVRQGERDAGRLAAFAGCRFGFPRLDPMALSGLFAPDAVHHAEKPAFYASFALPVMTLLDGAISRVTRQLVRLLEEGETRLRPEQVEFLARAADNRLRPAVR